MVFQSIATPSEGLEYLSDRKGRFNRSAGPRILLTRLPFEYLDPTAIGSEWEQRLQSIRDRERTLRTDASALGWDIKELEERSKRLRSRIDAFRSLSLKEWAGIQIDLQTKKAGAYEIRLDYVVPGACWRPYHTAQLKDGDATSLRFSSDACVWQNTGENWNEAQILFSTERLSSLQEPSLTAPPLQTSSTSSCLETTSPARSRRHRSAFNARGGSARSEPSRDRTWLARS